MYNAMSWLQAIKLLLNAQYIRQVNSVVYFYSRLESFFYKTGNNLKNKVNTANTARSLKKNQQKHKLVQDNKCSFKSFLKEFRLSCTFLILSGISFQIFMPL